MSKTKYFFLTRNYSVNSLTSWVRVRTPKCWTSPNPGLRCSSVRSVFPSLWPSGRGRRCATSSCEPGGSGTKELACMENWIYISIDTVKWRNVRVVVHRPVRMCDALYFVLHWGWTYNFTCCHSPCWSEPCRCESLAGKSRIWNKHQANFFNFD